LGIPAEVKVMVLVPRPTLLTRTPTLVALPVMVTKGGTVATAVLLEAKSTRIPVDGAGPDNVIVMVPVTPLPTIVSGEGDVERVKPTFTVEVAGARLVPTAETVIDVEPEDTPVTVTGVRDVVCPVTMEICEGETVATPVLAEDIARVTVLAAGFTKLIGNETVFPGVTAMLEGTLMLTVYVSVTLAVAVVTLALLAWMVAVPAATPVTDTVVVVWPAAMVTVLEATVAAAVLVDDTLKVIPPAGAGPERVNVRGSVAVPGIERVDGERLIVAATCTDWLPFE
jgi:hypothetical protein